MSIELTRQQQEALDRSSADRKRLIDPRTETAYVLVPEVDYDEMRELLDDKEFQRLIHAVGLHNAASRMDEAP